MAEYILKIMDGCIETVDDICSEIGAYISESVIVVLGALLDLLLHVAIIITIPIWYLPYKICRKRGRIYGQKKSKKKTQYRS